MLIVADSRHKDSTISVKAALSREWKYATSTRVVFCGGTGRIAILPETELQTVCLIFRILPVTKEANDLVDSSSGGTDAEVMVSLSTTVN